MVAPCCSRDCVALASQSLLVGNQVAVLLQDVLHSALLDLSNSKKHSREHNQGLHEEHLVEIPLVLGEASVGEIGFQDPSRSGNRQGNQQSSLP